MMLQAVLPFLSDDWDQFTHPASQSERRTDALWLSIHFPQLSLEVMTRDEDAALAVVEEKAGRCVVFEASDQAVEAGVSSGMPMNAAYALCPELQIQPRQPRQELALMARLAAWAERFTPMVNLEEGALLLEVGASLAYFGGLQCLLRQVEEGLRSQVNHFSLAVAPTPLAARLLAEYGDGQTVEQREGLRSVLGSLPLHCLPIDAKRIQRLAKTGVRNLRDVWRLPRDGLARRFGVDLLLFLDRALGEQPDPRAACKHVEPFSAEAEFYRETDNSGFILTAAEELLSELVDFLQKRDAGVSRFHLKLFHQQRAATELCVGLRQTSRDAGHFLLLLDEHLKNIVLPAPVVSVTLLADEIEPFAVEKQALFKTEASADSQWERTLEALQSRFGAEAVQGLICVEDHRPENAWQYGESDEKVHKTDRAKRPLWLLPEPEPLRQRGLQILQGPERIEGGWWAGTDVRRDYYVALDNRGSRLWIFHDLKRGGWFLHGVFA